MLKIKSIAIKLPAPEIGLELCGYSVRRLITAADDILQASFIMLAGEVNIIVGSVDTLFIGEKFLADLRCAGVKEKLLLFATHTHNAPSLVPELTMLGKVDDGWYQKVLSEIVNAIVSLRSKEFNEVEVFYGEAYASLNVNRRKKGFILDYKKLIHGNIEFSKKIAMACNKYGAIDRRVRLISFESENGSKTIMWTFAAHAAFEPRTTVVSPDYPGQINKDLKRVFGNECTVIFLPGFAGSAIPLAKQRIFVGMRELLMRLLPFNPMLPTYSLYGYRKWTKKLFDKLLEAWECRVRINASQVFFKEGLVESIFVDKISEKKINLKVAYLSFGHKIGLLAYNGEMLGEWQEYIKSLQLDHIIFSGYSGGECLYVPPSALLSDGGYEVDRFQQFFGLNGNFCSDITERVVETSKSVLLHDEVTRH